MGWLRRLTGQGPGECRVSIPVKEATVEATIIKADGTVVPLGVVSYYHRDWKRRLWWRLKNAVRAPLRRRRT